MRWSAPTVNDDEIDPIASLFIASALHPVGRMGEMRDVVDAVLYLETAGFVTGEILHVDGGQNAGRW